MQGTSNQLSDERARAKYDPSITRITDFFQYGADLSHGAAFNHKDVSFTPEVTTMQDGGVCRFIIPRRGFLDFRDAQLQFTVKNIGGTTLKGVDWGSWNYLKRTRVLMGSTVLHDLENANWVQNLKHAISPPTASNSMAQVSGYTSRNTTAGTGADAGKFFYDTIPGALYDIPYFGIPYNQMPMWARSVFAKADYDQDVIIPLNLAVLSQCVLPCELIEENIIIEFYFQKAKAILSCISAIDSLNADPVFSFRNIKIRGNEVIPSPAWKENVRSLFLSGGISWRFNAWETSVRVAKVSEEELPITTKHACVNNIYAIHAPFLGTEGSKSSLSYPSYTNVGTADAYVSDKSWVWPDLNCTEWAFKLDGEYYPPDKVKVTPSGFSPKFDTKLYSSKFFSVGLRNSSLNDPLDSSCVHSLEGVGVCPYSADHIRYIQKQLKLAHHETAFPSGTQFQLWNKDICHAGIDFCDPLNNVRAAVKGLAGPFIMCHNFEAFNGSSLIDGLDTRKSDSAFSLYIKYSEAPAAPIKILFLVEYEKLITLTRDGVRVSD